MTTVTSVSSHPDLRESLTKVLRELKQEAVGGIVTTEAFERATAPLRLDTESQKRVIDVLSQLGLLVRPPGREASSLRGEEMAAQDPERLEHVLPLVARCAVDNAVPADRLRRIGVLAGLDPAEMSALPEAVRKAGYEIVEAEPSVKVWPDVADAKAPRQADKPGNPPDLDAAVAAARRLLASDRRRQRPDRRLLSAEEEVGLGVLLRGGNDQLDVEPADSLFAELPADNERRRARDALVLHNQRLVHSNVRGYLDRGLEYDDLAQHGMLGLMHAACKFDGTQGYKFSTYATWWIRQALSQAVADEGATIRIPVHMHETMRKVAATETRLRAENRPATAVDVALACGLDVPTIDKVRRLSRVTDSLDRVILDGMSLGEVLSAVDPAPSPEQVLRHKFSRQVVEGLLRVLPDREADILRRRIGLVDGDVQTLDEVGSHYGVTRERIRQLESRALKRLREGSSSG
jgi:RNA polymerase primary sigma factor